MNKVKYTESLEKAPLLKKFPRYIPVSVNDTGAPTLEQRDEINNNCMDIVTLINATYLMNAQDVKGEDISSPQSLPGKYYTCIYSKDCRDGIEYADNNLIVLRAVKPGTNSATVKDGAIPTTIRWSVFNSSLSTKKYDNGAIYPQELTPQIYIAKMVVTDENANIITSSAFSRLMNYDQEVLPVISDATADPISNLNTIELEENVQNRTRGECQKWHTAIIQLNLPTTNFSRVESKYYNIDVTYAIREADITTVTTKFVKINHSVFLETAV
ncbi:hypothetical protein [Serratia bockelmannii]|uniref:hypothetical protein n=1 Tax=Serratia bockelmannii TaxID=2703793 RepID=UPI003FA7C04F